MEHVLREFRSVEVASPSTLPSDLTNSRNDCKESVGTKDGIADRMRRQGLSYGCPLNIRTAGAGRSALLAGRGRLGSTVPAVPRYT